MTEPILKIENLEVTYRTERADVRALNGVNLDVTPGEVRGVVGESGCGKSTLAFAVMRYLDRNGEITGGRILFKGEDLREKSDSEMDEIWGKHLGMIYQDPTASLNPSLPVGDQIAEVATAHGLASRDEAIGRAIDLLDRVHIRDPEEIIDRYPHELSGGMRQRVGIAAGLMGKPELLVMDEPTTNLDVTTEAKILDIVEELKNELNSAFLYITHDLGVIARVGDGVEVMYAGQVVEQASIDELFEEQYHPYTKLLLRSIPDPEGGKDSLQEVPGSMVDLTDLPKGCNFSTRCPFRSEECSETEPYLEDIKGSHSARCFEAPIEEAEETVGEEKKTNEGSIWDTPPELKREGPILSVDRLKKHFGGGGNWFPWSEANPVRAVDGVDLDLQKGQTVGVVGESGCGKTTLARTIIGLTSPTEGKIKFAGEDITVPIEKRSGQTLKRIQIVFQDPRSTLNPKRTVGQAIARPLILHGEFSRDIIPEKTARLLRSVGLDPTLADRFPDQLSGGQKQRVAAARAFATNPALVLHDEPTSSLDVSVQATILNLLRDLQEDSGTSYLFISHDLNVVRHISNYIAVMYLGHVVEYGTTEEIFSPPYHPYTEALLSAIPVPDPNLSRKRIRLTGSVPSAVDPPSGCVFHTRCPRKVGEICETESPPVCGGGEHEIHCHIPEEELNEVESVLS
ncbi:MAG: ABC transporter ATP-binding protein [Candidatus Bipolaricaulota bacterium]|nr:ABC transporter ATP-binding protein [Candidatus Bipolaricaulota bacterium]